jgi:hypothetical protein
MDSRKRTRMPQLRPRSIYSPKLLQLDPLKVLAALNQNYLQLLPSEASQIQSSQHRLLGYTTRLVNEQEKARRWQKS